MFKSQEIGSERIAINTDTNSVTAIEKFLTEKINNTFVRRGNQNQDILLAKHLTNKAVKHTVNTTELPVHK